MLNKWLQVAARVFLLPVESYSQSDFITRLILIIIKQKLAVYLDCDCLKRSVRALQITISFLRPYIGKVTNHGKPAK